MPSTLSNALDAVRVRIAAPGLAAGLRYADGTEEYAACGLARRDDGLALRPDMAFPAGSVIKPCIGALALGLAADGALGLDDPLAQWVPEFCADGAQVFTPAASPATPGDDQRVDIVDAPGGATEAEDAALKSRASQDEAHTLRQVLHHTAGIKCFTELLYWLPYPLQVHNASKHWTDADALAIANHFPPYFAPGAGFHYSNCGYALLGLALERAASAAAGRSVGMEELLRTRVFAPAGIAPPDGVTRYIRDDPPRPNTQARADTPWPALEMHGYMQPEHGGHDVTQYETYSLYGPAGALLSSLPDLLKLSAWLWGADDSHGGADRRVSGEAGGHGGPPNLANRGNGGHGGPPHRGQAGQRPALLDAVPADGPGKRYGLGVQLFERDWAGGEFYGHGGNVMGTTSGMWFFPARGLHLAFVANRALAWERPVFEALLAWADGHG
jgi:CubicO group peptidase (beta-lactamase class C family)